MNVSEQVCAAVTAGRVLWSDAYGWLLSDADQPAAGVDIVDVGDDQTRQRIVALHDAGLIVVEPTTGKACWAEGSAGSCASRR